MRNIIPALIIMFAGYSIIMAVLTVSVPWKDVLYINAIIIGFGLICYGLKLIG